MKKIRWIVFDYGGVISKKQNPALVREMCALLDISQPDFSSLYPVYRNDYDAALIDNRTYWNKTLGSINKKLSEAEMEKLISLDISSWLDINQETMEYIKGIKGKINLAILSNMTYETLSIINKSDWLDCFQAGIFSCEEKVCKPESKIFSILLERINASNSSVLFIDDTEKNIEAAKDMGINAIRFIDCESTVRDIRDNYIFSVSG